MLVYGLHIIDLAIILTSLVVILAVGVWVSRGVKHQADFFVGGRKLGGWLVFFLNFGSMTDTNSAANIATEVYRQGVGGMWIGFQALFATPFYWFSAVWFRRTRLITFADLFKDRFNSTYLPAFFAITQMVVSILSMGMGNIISYKVAAAMIVKPENEWTLVERQQVEGFREYQGLKAQYAAGTLPAEKREQYRTLDEMNKRGHLSSFISYVKPTPFYIGYTAIVGTYILFGGLKAAAITDAVQGVLILIFSVLLIPIGLIKIGGFQALHQMVPEFKFRLFGTEMTSEYTWFSILAIIFNCIVGIGFMSGAASASGRNERTMRIGILTGAFAKRFVMVAWMFCGLLALALFGQGLSDPDNTWGTLSKTLLGPGLMGLMISGMLLGHMPAVGLGAVNLSALFTRNLYQPLVKGRSEQHYMVVAKVLIVFVMGLGILSAQFFSGAIPLLTALLNYGVFYGAVGYLIYFWRPLTLGSLWASLVIWLAINAILPWTLPQFESFRQSPAMVLQTRERVVTVTSEASREDVAAGRAEKVGQAIKKTHVTAPASIFFESVVRKDLKDPNSRLEGKGRFHLENYVLYHMGLPMENFSPGGLMASRWYFDGLAPFVLLMAFSYIRLRRRRRVPVAVGAGGGAEMEEEVDEQEVRNRRFFAKLKTPVGAKPEDEQRELALSFANPDRFNHQKLFPGTNWEFTKWSKDDVLGFAGCWGIVLVVLAFLWAVLNIGA